MATNGHHPAKDVKKNGENDNQRTFKVMLGRVLEAIRSGGVSEVLEPKDRRTPAA